MTHGSNIPMPYIDQKVGTPLVTEENRRLDLTSSRDLCFQNC